MLKRDMLRGVVAELQKRTGVRVSATRHLTSQEGCYNAILEIGKRNGVAKEIEVLSKVNIALNDINCELKKENAELKKELETLKLNNKILKETYSLSKSRNIRCKVAIDDLNKENKELSKSKKILISERNRLQDEVLDLHYELEEAENKIKANKRLNILMLILVLTSLGLRLWELYL